MAESGQNTLNACKNSNENENSKQKHDISYSLDENIKYLKQKFGKSEDFMVRKMNILNENTAIFSIDGMINKGVFSDNILIPITNPALGSDIKTKNSKEKFEFLRDTISATADLMEVKSYEQVIELLMSGFAIIMLDGHNSTIAIGVQGFAVRSISEPTNEVMEKASKEAFIEPMRINMTMIRRRIKNTTLHFETQKLGSISKTEICLCYLTDKVSPRILEEVKAKLKKIDLKMFMASQYAVPYLEEKGNFSLFSSVGITERPDVLCSKIADGRIAILVDGTPFALIVPYLFVEYFQQMDDYASKPFFGTLIRWVKYAAFLLAVLLPGIYIGISTFNPEVLPSLLLNKLAAAIGTTPFSLFSETFFLLIVYEIMREAGLRLPNSLGHAIGIIGGLVIGEAAVQAGLVGRPTLMVVAFSVISSYVIPKIYESITLLRFVFIIAGGVLGIWGIMLALFAVLIDICTKDNFEIPFTAPVLPFSWFGMRDVLFRVSWKTMAKRELKIHEMPGVNLEAKK